MTTISSTTETFRIALDVAIRPCRAEDVPVLEWWGQYFAHRSTIEATWEAQLRGEALMLVAEVNGYPAGQAWIDLSRRTVDSVGVVWAVRVFPLLQGQGIGQRLMESAERHLAGSGVDVAELTVEKSNEPAIRFYQRRGYQIEGEVQGSYTYHPPFGGVVEEPVDQWVMRKALREARS